MPFSRGVQNIPALDAAGRSRGAIIWDYDTLTPTLGKLTFVIEAEVRRIMHQQAARVETYMKDNAPWSDITGAARDGLGAKPVAGVDSFDILLYHSVSYGIWLEIRWGGKFAIIEPTMEEMGPMVMQGLSGLLVRSAIIAKAL